MPGKACGTDWIGFPAGIKRGNDRDVGRVLLRKLLSQHFFFITDDRQVTEPKICKDKKPNPGGTGNQAEAYCNQKAAEVKRISNSTIGASRGENLLLLKVARRPN